MLPRAGDGMLSAAGGVFENCSNATTGGQASFRRLGRGESFYKSSLLFLTRGLDLKQQPQLQYYLGWTIQNIQKIQRNIKMVSEKSSLDQIQPLWKLLDFCQTEDEFGLILLILNKII